MGLDSPAHRATLEMTQSQLKGEGGTGKTWAIAFVMLLMGRHGKQLASLGGEKFE